MTRRKRGDDLAHAGRARGLPERHTCPAMRCMDYLREHATGRVYQVALNEAIYYGPDPVWGDAFGPWRYADFIVLPPAELARKLRGAGLRRHRRSTPALAPLLARPARLSTHFALDRTKRTASGPTVSLPAETMTEPSSARRAALAHRRRHPVLQRGAGHRAGGGRLPRGAARGRDPRLRQQLDRRHRRRGRAPPAPASRTCALRGKGNVARRMFADVEADVYVMVDGDATYDVGDVRAADRHAGRRQPRHGGRHARRRRRTTCRPTGAATASATAADRRGGAGCSAAASPTCCRATACSRGATPSPSRRCPGASRSRPSSPCTRSNCACPSPRCRCRYRARPEGSESKLSTYRDGWRILQDHLQAVRERAAAAVLLAASRGLLVLLSLVLARAAGRSPTCDTGLVPRLPTAVLVTGIMLSAMLSFVCGIVLHTVTIGRQEAKRLRYLAIPGVRSTARRAGHEDRRAQFLSFAVVGAIGLRGRRRRAVPAGAAARLVCGARAVLPCRGHRHLGVEPALHLRRQALGRARCGASTCATC